jgi:hypothetical protein
MSLWSNTVNLRLATLGISQQVLSSYCGIHTNRLSKFCSGVQDLPNVDLMRVADTLDALEKLCAAANPWPLDIRNISQMKLLMKQFRNGELDAMIGAMRAAYAPVAPEVPAGAHTQLR